MIQSGLFDDDKIVHVFGERPHEAARLTRQCGLILDRLRNGYATNVELARIAIRYSARIKELRDAGYQIVMISRNKETGVNVYSLKA